MVYKRLNRMVETLPEQGQALRDGFQWIGVPLELQRDVTPVVVPAHDLPDAGVIQVSMDMDSGGPLNCQKEYVDTPMGLCLKCLPGSSLSV